jgi:hypothetical protein
VYAGILAHYAGDLEMPLHLTIHFDGMTGKDGVSPRSGIHNKVDALIEKVSLPDHGKESNRLPHAYHDLMTGIWQEIKTVHQLVPGIYVLEGKIPAADDAVSDPAVQAFAQERLASASVFLANLYLTAWANAHGIIVPDWDSHGKQ